jgi:hypothetical protein
MLNIALKKKEKHSKYLLISFFVIKTVSSNQEKRR